MNEVHSGWKKLGCSTEDECMCYVRLQWKNVQNVPSFRGSMVTTLLAVMTDYRLTGPLEFRNAAIDLVQHVREIPVDFTKWPMERMVNRVIIPVGRFHKVFFDTIILQQILKDNYVESVNEPPVRVRCRPEPFTLKVPVRKRRIEL